jgi:hypothetical protein
MSSFHFAILKTRDPSWKPPDIFRRRVVYQRSPAEPFLANGVSLLEDDGAEMAKKP